MDNIMEYMPVVIAVSYLNDYNNTIAKTHAAFA